MSDLYGETFGASRLSKSTVSRITQQLNQDFDTWRRRDLSDLIWETLGFMGPAGEAGACDEEISLCGYGVGV